MVYFLYNFGAFIGTSCDMHFTPVLDKMLYNFKPVLDHFIPFSVSEQCA